jgi:hypothetical protein
VERTPERASQLGELARAEDEERDEENDEQLGRPYEFEKK